MHCEFCNADGHLAHDCDEFHRAQAVAAEMIEISLDDYAVVDAVIGSRRALSRREIDELRTFFSEEG